ncbi:MAG: WG repeat-containing protein [Pyrinomonadaceae bacterium]|nr:WG repeat-containing protein [Pyrinomonadaceae bacterium]
MMKTSISRALAILVSMAALTPAVRLQQRKLVVNPSRHLYRVVNNDGKVGFIDATGSLVIGFSQLPKGTAYVRAFHEGRAVIYVKKENGDAPKNHTAYNAGYIDETGNIVISARFDEAYDFSEDLAYVRSESVNAFINRQGRVVISFNGKTWPSLEVFGYGFHEGFAAVSVNTEVGFIDRTGKLLCKGYTSAARFSEGLAAVVVGRGRQAKYGFVNAKGELVIAPRFDPVLRHEQIESLSHFSEGLASVRVGNMYGYIDKKGNFVIPPQFLFAGDFSEGLAFVKLQGKAGYVDKSGHWVIAPQEVVFRGGRFSEGLAPVSLASGWGYIDRTGKIVIKPQFFQAFEFDGGVAAVDLLSESGSRYIDKTGKYIWRQP